MPMTDPLFSNVLWSLATVASFGVARAIAKRHARWWTSPLILAPAMLLVAALVLHTSYQAYIRGTHWLMLLLGPATVAFALPVYEQRALIRRHWPALVIGVVAGSSIAIGSVWALSSMLGLSEALRLSMLPRSISTPFALAVAGRIGGLPDLTAVFVILTAICGTAFGERILRSLPLRSSLARGALFGMGAHAAGVAKAHQIGGEEGSVAGLVLVMAGLLNVLAAPVLAMFLR